MIAQDELDAARFRLRPAMEEVIAKALYRGILGRAPDPGGLENAIARLRANSGSTGIAALIQSFLNSEEYKRCLSKGAALG